MGVMPKQEVTGAGVDVDDFQKAAGLLMQKGCRRVGTLHTHPGSMSSCSSTDTGQMWDKFGGIHLVVPRAGGKVGVYFSTHHLTWEVTDKEWEYKLWEDKQPTEAYEVDERDRGIVTENDDKEYKDVVKEKVYVYSSTYATQDWKKEYGLYGKKSWEENEGLEWVAGRGWIPLPKEGTMKQFVAGGDWWEMEGGCWRHIGKTKVVEKKEKKKKHGMVPERMAFLDGMMETIEMQLEMRGEMGLIGLVKEMQEVYKDTPKYGYTVEHLIIPNLTALVKEEIAWMNRVMLLKGIVKEGKMSKMWEEYIGGIEDYTVLMETIMVGYGIQEEI